MSGSRDIKIKVWNIQERREEFSLQGHSDLIRSVAISSDSNYIISRSIGNIIKVWNIQERREEFPLRGHDSYICNIELDRKSTRLNSSHSDRSRMPSSA